MAQAKQLMKLLREIAVPSRAVGQAKFLQISPGGYGEGDKCLGVDSPSVHKLVKQFRTMPLPQIETLIRSEYHEDRMTGLELLVDQFKVASKPKTLCVETQEAIYTVYINHLEYVNNWDLVDISAYKIVGPYLNRHQTTKQRQKQLVSWAKSSHIWTRRVAIISTMHSIKYVAPKEFADTFLVAKILVQDPHDLIHKGVGWMLREVSNNDTTNTLTESFLREHYSILPRTMLRYAIEKFPEPKRKMYLKGAFVKESKQAEVEDQQPKKKKLKKEIKK